MSIRNGDADLAPFDLLGEVAKPNRRASRVKAIPFAVRVRPECANGGKAWIIDIRPNAEGRGYPCEFKRWEVAAVFIEGLNEGRVDQSCFSA